MDTSKLTQESQVPSSGDRVNIPSYSKGQAFENPPSSIVTSQDRGESPRGINKRSKGKFSNWVDSYTVDQLLQAQKNDAVMLKVTELKCQSDIYLTRPNFTKTVMRSEHCVLNGHSLSEDKEYCTGSGFLLIQRTHLLISMLYLKRYGKKSCINYTIIKHLVILWSEGHCVK